MRASRLFGRVVPRGVTIVVWAVAKGSGLAGSVFTGLVTAGLIASAAGKDISVSGTTMRWTLLAGLAISIGAWATERYVDDDLRHTLR